VVAGLSSFAPEKEERIEILTGIARLALIEQVRRDW
jgi:hypothetical protein